MTKKQSLISILLSFDFGEVVDFWNLYSRKCDRENDRIYLNEDNEIDACFPDSSEFARASKYGDYDYEDKYFCVDACGNLLSFSDIHDRRCPIRLTMLAEYLVENGDSEFPIDDDWLLSDFLCEYFSGSDEEDKARGILERLGESEPMDLLMEEWDYLYGEIKSHWDE